MKKQYTVHELATISGVSVRTLHYYDELGLLYPMCIAENGYRIYGSKEVDKLQQILFYRELKVPLKRIKDIMDAPDYDKAKELEKQLQQLLLQKEQLELLIQNISKTISNLKGENVMSDTEKFEGFKQKMINDNENEYGKEIREKYGDEIIDALGEDEIIINEIPYAERAFGFNHPFAPHPSFFLPQSTEHDDDPIFVYDSINEYDLGMWLRFIVEELADDMDESIIVRVMVEESPMNNDEISYTMKNWLWLYDVAYYMGWIL